MTLIVNEQFVSLTSVKLPKVLSTASRTLDAYLSYCSKFMLILPTYTLNVR